MSDINSPVKYIRHPAIIKRKNQYTFVILILNNNEQLKNYFIFF